MGRQRVTAGCAVLAMGAALLAGCGGGEAVAGDPASDTSASEESSATAETDSNPAETGEPDGVSPSAEPAEEWQRVRYRNATFEVPASWEVEQPGGDQPPLPTYGKGFCETDPENALGLVILTWTDETSDARDAVLTEAERAAAKFWPDRSPEVEVGEVEQNGDWAAVPAGVRFDPSEDPCAGTEGMLVVKGATYPDRSGTFLMIVVGELGLPESPTPEDLEHIANSWDS